VHAVGIETDESYFRASGRYCVWTSRVNSKKSYLKNSFHRPAAYAHVPPTPFTDYTRARGPNNTIILFRWSFVRFTKKNRLFGEAPLLSNIYYRLTYVFQSTWTCACVGFSGKSFRRYKLYIMRDPRLPRTRISLSLPARPFLCRAWYNKRRTTILFGGRSSRAGARTFEIAWRTCVHGVVTDGGGGSCYYYYYYYYTYTKNTCGGMQDRCAGRSPVRNRRVERTTTRSYLFIILNRKRAGRARHRSVSSNVVRRPNARIVQHTYVRHCTTNKREI